MPKPTHNMDLQNTTFHTINIKNIHIKNKNDILDENNNLKLNNLYISDIIDIDKENTKYINNATNVINLINQSYSNILSELTYLKQKFTEFDEYLKFKKDCIDSNQINEINICKSVQKDYDNLLEFSFQNILDHANMYLINVRGEKYFALSEIDKNCVTRNIGITYITRNGVVIGENLTKIDNLFITIGSEQIELTLNNLKFEVKKISGFKNFTISKLREYIPELLNNLYKLEKEIDKNIKILSYSLDIVNVIHTNIKVNNTD